jgi:CRP/FNR family transcriptional regulator
MSRSDIGNYLGIAEETVCRIFARFQDDGLISSEYRNVKLKNIKRLEQIANQKSLRQTNVASLYS